MINLKLLLLTLTLGISYTVYGHEGHTNLNAVKVCHEKEVSDSCSYILGENKLYKGSCRKIAEKMMCVRNQPIEVLLDKVEHYEETSNITLNH